MTQIILPNRFTPRDYQNEVMAYFDRGGSRACTVWHRRAGKDTTAIHQIAKMAHQRPGLYWHMLPTQRQARKVVWDAFTRSGDRLLDQALPPILRKGEPNNTEMKMPLKCGSMYQLVGSDSYDALVGSNPVGVVFSEWSLTDPRVWDYVRPILLENGGWAWFIYTPRGYNHGWDIKEIAEASDDWFYSIKTIDDTGIVTREDVDKEIREGMPKELAEQEFYCSFSSANVGAILGSYIEEAEREGRVLDGDLFDPDGSPVFVSSDIGYRDTAAWWFWQIRPDGPVLVDYDEDSGLDAEDWISRLQTSPWIIENVYLPHDAKAKTFATKHSVLEQFLKAGFGARVLPRMEIRDRINAARVVAKYARFHKTNCKPGLAALRDWSYTWDDKRKVFSQEPLHNWASHGGDGFSYGATIVEQHVKAWADRSAKKNSPAPKTARQGHHHAYNLEDLFSERESRRGPRV